MDNITFSKVINVTLNPAIDVTIWTEQLDFNEPVNSLKETNYAGGKSVNVSRVLTKLGVSNKLIGIAGEDNIEMFESLLSKDNVDFDFLKSSGNIRENLTLMFPDDKVLKINRQGSKVSGVYLKRLFNKIKSIIQIPQEYLVVFAGSLPPNIHKDEYKKFICDVKSLGVKVAIDTAVFTLQDYEQIKPFIIKPNKIEFDKIIGKNVSCDEMLVKSLLSFSENVEHIILSCGCGGVFYCCNKEIYKIIVPKVEVKTTVGAGDTTLSGFIYGIINKKSNLDSICYAAAAGTASVTIEGTGLVKKSMIKNILKDIEIIKIR